MYPISPLEKCCDLDFMIVDLWSLWTWVCSWTLCIYMNSYLNNPQRKKKQPGAQTQNSFVLSFACTKVDMLIGHVFLTWISGLYIWTFGQRHFVIFSGGLVAWLSLYLFGSCIIKPLNLWNSIFFQITWPYTAVCR